MNLFIFAIVTFRLIYNCVCFINDEEPIAHCNPEDWYDETLNSAEIILISDGKNNDRNEKFSANVRNKEINILIMNEICPGGIVGTIKALELYPDTEIMNLAVDDFYKFDYNYILNNGLHYAGDIGDSIETFNSYVIDMNETNTYVENNKTKNQNLHSVKLFSNRGILEPSFYDYVYDFQDNSDVYRKVKQSILICISDFEINKSILNQINNLESKYELKFTSNCKENIEIMKDNILAVITNEPIEMAEKVPFPIILCSNPLTHTMSPSNYHLTTLTSTNQIQVFQIAFMKFLKKVSWQRIAILSDTYEHSIEFERNLVSIFNKENVMYTVFRYEENVNGNYNFLEVLKSLEISDARIVILNMDKRNIEILSEHIRRNSNSDNNRAWIVKDILHASVVQNMGIVITINLTPALNAGYILNIINSHLEQNVNNFKTRSVLESILKVDDAYNKIIMFNRAMNKYDENIVYNEYRNLGKLLDNTSRTQVYITYQYGNIDPEVIASILFDELNITEEIYSLAKYMPPDMPECVLRSRNFFGPCNYFELIYLMFVLVVFFPTFFTVVIFFTDKNTNQERRRYNNF